ncbi:MAG: 30S ribosomal protein S7 [Candidatus Nealsonbacteria bacterium]|nr:30S ribosomal protein S7 [Candidatus Nealsonbacteria bacterium]
MARAKKVKIRDIPPDFVYGDKMVSKFINYIMERGKKNAARKIVYGAFDIIKKKTKQDPLDVFKRAMQNASPSLEVRPRRIGGATYQIPREVRGERRIALAMRWIIQAAKSVKGRPMKEKLAEEMMKASENTGWAIKKKENTHRMAEANRAFAHFSW